MGEVEDERCSQASQLFENFVQSSTCKGTLQAFGLLCRQLELDPTDHRGFYSNLKAAVTSWKAKALWTKLDKRANHKEYKKGRACTDLRCLVIGGGPCGLRTAIELALLGAKVVVIEKRDTFSRNNVLHLWPYTIHDLRNLGAKKFYGKFCAGAIDHISIRQLQLILLKVSLIVGVEVHVNVEFVKLLEPPEKQDGVGQGWRAEMSPVSHPISDYEFDVLIGADGRRSTLHGFKRKEFRGKLAIAITANFVNRNTTAEAKVEEISGVAFIFNQKFFLELKEETGIDLENIVYYKDNTHYFVMTAKKQSLLDKGVIIHDYIETERLLHSDNVNQEALLSYAREAADFGTNYQLPSLDYAMNHYGQPDVAMFDFTCMYASENAALIREKNGHQLLVALVGDSLLEPFWPMGTGCARGFLAAFDTVWMVQGWAQGKAPLEALSERESIYRLLPQTTAENISKNFEQHTIDPATRYPNLNSTCVRPHQVQHLYINGEQNPCSLERSGPTRRSVNISRKESAVRPSRLLLWCQKQTEGYRGVNVTDLTTSWRSGLALCALIHHQRPDLIDFDSLNEADSAKNNQLAFEVAEKTFSIQPLITGQEMAAEQEPDKLVMVLYLSKFYEMFCNSSISSSGAPKETSKNNEDLSSKPKNSVYNSTNLALLRKRIPKDDKKVEDDKKRRKGISYLDELSKQSTSTAVEEGEQKENKVRSMATQLQAKFEENAPSCVLRRQSESDSSSGKPVSLDMTENPRFAKPKQSSPPPDSPKPKWQPSPYLRLLESQMQHGNKQGHLETQQVQVWSLHTTMEDQTGFQSPESQLTSQTTQNAKPSTPELQSSLQGLSVSAAQHSTLKHVLVPKERRAITCKSSETPLISTAALHRLKMVEDKTTQKSGPSPVPDSSPKPLSCPSLLQPSALSCLLSPLPEAQPKQCNGHAASEPTTPDHQGHKNQSEIKRVQCLDPSIQRTVGKVSSVIGVKAATLAVLYETDHRPNNPYTLSLTEARRSQESGSVNLRKEFAPGMGGSDTCHFCKKRVYVMERLSAEGYFFHRECFRCDVCSATLRLGGHVFDQGTFYCKLHFSQRKTSHRLRKPQVHRSDVSVLDDTDGFSTSGSLHIKPSGVSSLPKTQEDLIIKVPQDIEKTAESSAEPQLSDPPKFTSNSMFGEPSVQDLATESEPLGPSSSQRVERSYARGDIIRNNHWKRKIRATLPLILLKSFEQKGAGDDALIEEDGDSDFEELHVPQEAENHASDSHCPLQEEPEKSAADEIPSYRTHGISSLPKSSPAQQPDASTPAPDQQSAFSSKKKLILSLSEKEKLLNWDLATPGTFSSTTEATDRAETYVRKPANSTEAQIHEEPRAPAEPEPSPTLSGFQLWASVLRRSFSGAGNNPKVIRRNRPRRVRPLSEGSFSFLFGVSAQNQEEDEDAVKRSRADTEGNQSRTEVRSEITAMLEQITLSNKPSRISKDDMASLPPRRLNFFSSMRMKRNDGGDRSKTGNQTKDVWSILSKFRNKASSQHNHHHDEDTYSSSEEDQKSVIQRSESGDSERRRKQQEKTLVMQTKREQLKQLHRAQVIQRQLEEVEEKQRALEEKGVALEKVLRGESEDAAVDESELLHTWFKLVLEKNKLARYESELMIFAQELELEDRQSQLQQDLRRRMATEDCKKSAAELAEEQVLLDEVMKVVEERDRLVSLLEEQRLQEKAEDHDLESLILSKGYQFHWA
ncbi:F-actin-monooxygenase mical2b isoform X3 [Tachysurus vachellii]|uniref:F-actin-monooxygenase mical2b isoform X3 n=1 Tax=Tachysurus vachellii TaxID=175792 RepID=UPI00296AED16|nr:F-actin-monooxygenase mical2b isoform X3 [Tachysurus vachellii]